MWGEFWAPLRPPDWEPEALIAIENRLGWMPHCSVEITVSGTIDGRQELASLVRDLLVDDGVATDFNGDPIEPGPDIADQF
jgi:hypothetical protein